ncbi:MAG: DUF1207 domain-containing protein [Planctomycetota bacterium]|nr:DUF1207 domain-containing protein [Planctomycetota bacterium]MDA1213394.1 DUF1207 domain-containing protein [Planctomycetota bacterium]
MTRPQFVDDTHPSGPGFPEQEMSETDEFFEDSDHRWVSHPNGSSTHLADPPPPASVNSYAPQHPAYYPSEYHSSHGPDPRFDSYDAGKRRLLQGRRPRNLSEQRQKRQRPSARQRSEHVPRKYQYDVDPFLNSSSNNSFADSYEQPGSYYDDQEYFTGDSLDGTYCDSCQEVIDEGWMWQLMPDSLLYKSYMAGPKESRLGTALVYDGSMDRWVMDTTLGGRVGLIRYGSVDDLPAEGWQLDLEGAAFPRFNADHNFDLQSADVKFAIPLTWSKGPYQAKFAYSHISSHYGDDYMFLNPGLTPSNYVKNSMVFGLGYFLTDHFRVYGEADYAFSRSGGAEEWQFQFGTDYIPVVLGSGGAPFFACNTIFREENNFGGAINILTGWAWHGTRTDHLIRAGVQYYNGKSSQLSFFRTHDRLIGFGLWYDF